MDGKTHGNTYSYSHGYAYGNPHGYAHGKVLIAHCGNPAAAERLMHMVKAVFEGAQVRVTECGGLCSYYAELGGLMVGFEDADA